jgi:hypothetical protein
MMPLAEGEELWNVFQAKIDYIELGTASWNNCRLKFDKDCRWYRGDQMHTSRDNGWASLEIN